MKKTRVKCPLCGIEFDPRLSYQHIKQYHEHATDHELQKIRDARRLCFGQPRPVKRVSTSLLKTMLIRQRPTNHKITAR